MTELSSSDETPDEEEVNRDFEAEAKLIVQTDTLPKKSAVRYMLVYDAYRKWQTEHKSSLSNSEESNLIVYFKDLSQRLKPSTLWSIWAMLRKTLNTRDNIDITKFHSLRSLVKNNSKSYKPKKSSVFKWSDIVKFMNEAPDFVYLAAKVMLVFGICGALRCDELAKLKTDDVENIGNKYLVSINDTKNDVPRQFVIGELFFNKVQQYISLKPEDSFTDRFFIQYLKGKCHRQVIGRNKIGETPRSIALYLNLKNPKLYTGHCFRRTAATLLSESGASSTMLRQLGGWKSISIAQDYVQNSMRNRQKIYESITHANSADAPLDPGPSTSRNHSTEEISHYKNEESTEVECNNFEEEFEINEEDLAAIEIPTPSTVTKPSTTGNNRKILPSREQQLIRSTHFLSKPPISVFEVSKESKNGPPVKKSKIEETQNKENEQPLKSISINSAVKNKNLSKPPVSVFEVTKGSKNGPPVQKSKIEETRNEENEQPLNTSSTNSAVNNNPNNKYENCVFHGNIINNFYYSNVDYEKNKKK